MAPRKSVTKAKAPTSQSKQVSQPDHKSNGQHLDAVALADELLKDISGKSSAIKKAIQTLDVEQTRLEQSFNARKKEIDKQRGRLNAYLVRLGGGAVVDNTPSKSNGQSRTKRLTSADIQALEVQVIELAGKYPDAGLKRGDVVEAFGLSGAQASKILTGLEQADRLNATGLKAGRRYFAR